MALSITIQPPAINFTKQPIIVKVNSDLAQGTDNWAITLLINTYAYVNSPATLVRLTEKPDSNGDVVFDISGILDEFIDEQIDFPSLASVGIQKCAGPLKFALALLEISGTPPSYPGLATMGDFFAVGGGIAYEKLGTPNFWSSYLPGKSPLIPFLTWKPDKIKSTISSSEYLYYYVLNSGITSLNIMVEIFGFNHASLFTAWNSYTHSSVVKDEMYLIPVGYSTTSIDTVLAAASINPNDVAYYKVWLRKQGSGSGLDISEKRTFFVDRKTYLNKKTFFFKNSLFGGDFLECTGEVEPKGDYTKQVATIALGIGSSVPKGMMRNFNSQERMGNKINSGYKTRKEIDWLRDLFISLKGFEVIGNEYYPIEIKSGSIEFPKPSDPVPAVKFEYSYLFTNKVYTPARYLGT